MSGRADQWFRDPSIDAARLVNVYGAHTLPMYAGSVRPIGGSRVRLEVDGLKYCRPTSGRDQVICLISYGYGSVIRLQANPQKCNVVRCIR